MAIPFDQIIQGDALDVIGKLPTKSVHLVLTDPPYTTPMFTAVARKVVRNLADLSAQEFYLRAFKKTLERILVPDGRVFIFCDERFYPILYTAFYEWEHQQLIVWDKTRIGFGNPIRRQHELLFYANRASYQPSSTTRSVIQCQPEQRRVHPAQKPLTLLGQVIEAFSKPYDVVLDPFAGSGSTLVAAQRLLRHYIGVELNHETIALAKTRLLPLSVA